MKRWSVQRLVLVIVSCVFAWILVASFCAFVGSSGSIGLPRDSNHQISGVILRYRIGMVLLASLIGAALAMAGAVYQAILKNPLADPYLLGVSSGAMLFSFLWQLPATTALFALGEQSCAFMGAACAVGIVFALSTRRGRLDPITMLLVGVIVNSVNASIFLFLNAIFKDPARPGGALAFLVGGLQSNASNAQLILAGSLIAIGAVVVLAISGSLNVSMLAETEAQSLGVRINRLRWIAMISSSLMTASAVALSGPIGFVGLVCPHLGRKIVGNDQRRLLPIAATLGAMLLCVADAISRWLASRQSVDTVLPVGVLTGLLGGPFFLLLLWRQRRATA